MISPCSSRMTQSVKVPPLSTATRKLIFKSSAARLESFSTEPIEKEPPIVQDRVRGPSYLDIQLRETTRTVELT